jgi:hypothetical protein
MCQKKKIELYSHGFLFFLFLILYRSNTFIGHLSFVRLTIRYLKFLGNKYMLYKFLTCIVVVNVDFHHDEKNTYVRERLIR